MDVNLKRYVTSLILRRSSAKLIVADSGMCIHGAIILSRILDIWPNIAPLYDLKPINKWNPVQYMS